MILRLRCSSKKFILPYNKNNKQKILVLIIALKTVLIIPFKCNNNSKRSKI